MKIALVVPHIFMHRDILPRVIFSPGTLAIDLAEGMQELGHDVTLFSPGPIDTSVNNVSADLSYFEAELAARDDTYIDLLKKHPLTFITLSRQVQSETLADVFARANNHEFDLVHIYTNEEDTALPFSALCKKPVVFTHHDPFNFLVKYRSIFSKYRHLNWLSISMAQRTGMPIDTNWTSNIYHGLPANQYTYQKNTTERYIAYVGRIIEPKGVHLAIKAVQAYNQLHYDEPLQLKIAGKHYSGKKDAYWQDKILPELDDPNIQYAGFKGSVEDKQELIGNAQALIIPSIFDEPFGMVMIEALACGTPVIGLNSGAIPEIIDHKRTGFVVDKQATESETIAELALALESIDTIDRNECRSDFEARFTRERMSRQHIEAYESLTK